MHRPTGIITLAAGLLAAVMFLGPGPGAGVGGRRQNARGGAAAVGGEAQAETAGAAAEVAGGKAFEAACAKNIAAWKAEDPGEPADNSFCYVCHVNYEEEKLVRAHHPVGVGCETCHGMSDQHSEDEDNLIPPDILFPKARIDSFCSKCHGREELLDVEDHETIFAKENRTTKACTDCHGQRHRLKVRTRKWNKVTRELTWYDGVRMMQKRGAGGK